MNYPIPLIKLIAQLRKFPGVGTRTAEKFAFDLLEWPEKECHALAESILQASHEIFPCGSCGCLMEKENCLFCTAPERHESRQMCIIATARDALAIENTKAYHGLYHVMGGLLSPLEGRGPEELNFTKLQSRLLRTPIDEIVIAFDATLEGDTTALYIKKFLSSYPLKISRLAFGMPMGSPLEGVDGGTLARALVARALF